MKFRKPHFWDFKKPNFLSNILILFTFIIKINNFLFRFKNLEKFKNIKTICVGNIYIGGTGKTPTTIKLYEMLKSLNIDISTAKKFYKSQTDEQIILNSKSNLITGSDRKKIIIQALKKNKKLLIFDDGLQDKHINYDLRFVCFDSKNWIGNGRLIPAGPLRENLVCLNKYDGVFLKGEKENSIKLIDKIKSINPKIQIFFTNYEPVNISEFNKDENYIIFSGIGNPENFKDLLIKNNLKIKQEIIFPDHYNYKKKDIEKIKFKANQAKAKIITTQKDFVKIKEFDCENIKFLQIDLKIENEKNLLNFIKEKLYA